MTPTIGRIILFRSSNLDEMTGLAALDAAATEVPGIVTAVHSDTCISATVFREGQSPIAVSSVEMNDSPDPLVAPEAEEGEETPTVRGWRWMDYQKAQADQAQAQTTDPTPPASA